MFWTQSTTRDYIRVLVWKLNVRKESSGRNNVKIILSKFRPTDLSARDDSSVFSQSVVVNTDFSVHSSIECTNKSVFMTTDWGAAEEASLSNKSGSEFWAFDFDVVLTTAYFSPLPIDTIFIGSLQQLIQTYLWFHSDAFIQLLVLRNPIVLRRWFVSKSMCCLEGFFISWLHLKKWLVQRSGTPYLYFFYWILWS